MAINFRQGAQVLFPITAPVIENQMLSDYSITTTETTIATCTIENMTPSDVAYMIINNRVFLLNTTDNYNFERTLSGLEIGICTNQPVMFFAQNAFGKDIAFASNINVASGTIGGLHGRNHLSFQPMQQLYNLINEKVIDINADRRNQTDPRKRQWIFPSYPEANDENYPRVALINENIRFEEYGSGRIVEYEKDILGNTDAMLFSKVATLPITIGVFVKKKQRHEVSYYDASVHTIQNTKQADFLGEEIEKAIEIWRELYFIPYNMDIKITGISRTYDDNDFLIAKNIDIEITMMDEWELNFQDPSCPYDLIRQINTNLNI